MARKSSSSLVEDVVRHAGSAAAAADALGITRQHLNRLRRREGALGLVATARAILLLNRDPVTALKEAGETEAATILPRIFRGQVSEAQLQFLRDVDALPAEQRRLVQDWVKLTLQLLRAGKA